MDAHGPIPFRLTEFPTDRFQVLAELGQGGMGEVHKARDRHLNRMVALKVLKDPSDPDGLARLLAEAQYQASLHHPHVVQIFEVGRWRGEACLVMQFVQGRTLDLAAAGLTLAEKLELVMQAIDGVHAAHRAGFLHRDLKPRNILVEEPEEGPRCAYVMDFGLARDAGPTFQVGDGDLIEGSPFFMSPEQAAGDRMLDLRSDIYSLGATLHFLLVGQPPLWNSDHIDTVVSRAPAGAAGSGRERLVSWVRHLRTQEKAAPHRRTALPTDLDTILGKCLEPSPHLRYESALELAEDLRRFMAGEPILARRPSLGRRIRVWFRRHPRTTAALAAGLLLVLSAGATSLAVARRGRQRQELAVRFEHAAQEVIARHRLSSLSPVHDRRQDDAWILQRATEWEAERQRLGAVAAGPIDYALGQVDLLFGRHRRALNRLEAAWKVGHRTPSNARALGMAHLALYRDAWFETPANAGEERQDALKERHLKPALGFLRQGTSQETPSAAEAWIALLQGDEARALDLAAAVLQQRPWEYEILLVPFHVRAQRAERAPSLPAFLRLASEATTCLEDAIARAASDPRFLTRKASWLNRQSLYRLQREGVEGTDLLEQALALGTLVERIDPDDVDMLLARSDTHNRLALQSQLMAADPGTTRDFHRRALADAERALKLAPQSAGVLTQRAWCITHLAELGLSMGDRNAPTPEDALAACERALALGPDRVEGQHVLMRAEFLVARGLQLRQRDDTPVLERIWKRLEGLLPAWPGHTAFRVQAYQVLTRLSTAAFVRGQVELAYARLEALTPIFDQHLAAQPDNQFFRMLYAIVRNQQAMVEGHRGGELRPLLLDGLRKLEAVAEPARLGYDYTDTSFNLRYALLQLPEGPSPERERWRQELWALVDRSRSRHMAPTWYRMNEAMLLRWEALQAQRQGRSAMVKLQRALALIRPLLQGQPPPSLSMEHSLEAALRILIAHDPRGSHVLKACTEAAAVLKAQCPTDPVSSWLFLPEWRMAELCAEERRPGGDRVSPKVR